jgi:hypothetical protein
LGFFDGVGCVLGGWARENQSNNRH